MSTERRRQRRELPEPIWTRPEPGSRRAAYTREDIARTALAIADAEGFEAVSMRRVARELGAGTMTLYHYVQSKEELIALMDDHMMAEVVVPDDEFSDDWREALTQIGRRSLAAWRNHPWAKDSPPGASLGPNGVRHFEQSLQAVAGTRLDWPEKLDIIAMVDEYVIGYALRDAEIAEEMDRREWIEPFTDYLDAQLEQGDFPQIQALVGEDGTRATLERFIEMTRDEGRFERGLERLLDGIALDIERRRS